MKKGLPLAALTFVLLFSTGQTKICDLTDDSAATGTDELVLADCTGNTNSKLSLNELKLFIATDVDADADGNPEISPDAATWVTYDFNSDAAGDLRFGSETSNSVIIGNTSTTANGGIDTVIVGTDALSKATCSPNTNNTIIGHEASGCYHSTAVGMRSTAGGNFDTTFGYDADCNGSGNTSCVSIGFQADGSFENFTGGADASTGLRAVAVGYDADCGNDSICIGRNADSTATNQLVIGSSSPAINSVFIGKGVAHATPTGTTISTTGGSGTNIAGASLNIAGGRGTGSGAGGAVNIQTAAAGGSGSSQNALSTIVSVLSTGVVRFTALAAAPATCSIGDFYVDTSGAYCACTSTDTWENTTATGSCA